MSSTSSLILADGHVHIHDCFPLDAFFDAAWKNFRQVQPRFTAVAGPASFILFLTESRGVHYFQRFRELAEVPREGEINSLMRWWFQETGEAISLRAVGEKGKSLMLISGRQIVTKENLEVLGLGLAQEIPDGMSILQTIEAVLAQQGLPVVPWGFGKWSGRRGKIIRELIDSKEGRTFFVGDNGNRPLFYPLPALIKAATERGIPNLPGSDPLPFASEADRPGSFGFAVETSLSTEKPAVDLIAQLQSDKLTLKPFGKKESPFSFVRNQFAMQIVKRK